MKTVKIGPKAFKRLAAMMEKEAAKQSSLYVDPEVRHAAPVGFSPNALILYDTRFILDEEML